MSLYSELKDRKVIRVAAVYLVVAWLIVQVVVAVSGPFLLPDWFARAVILLLALGFPFALILSWIFDATPAEGSDSRSGKPLAFGLIAATAVVIGFIVTGFNSGDSPEGVVAIEVVQEVAPAEESTVLPNSVAVLPFDNLSPDQDNAYFAAGIHESTLNQLAKIRDLTVIARTSVLQYAEDPPPIPEIAKALRVEMVMEGSVRYANDRVLITAQLIDGETGGHVWSDEFNRDLSDIFAVQAEIATQIAAALQAVVLPGERESIETPDTQSTEAYALYLRALEQGAYGPGSDLGLIFLDQAIELDPKYALAYARKAFLLSLDFADDVIDSTDAGLASRLEAEIQALASRALELDPSQGLAHVALANVHQSFWRESQAMSEYQLALELSSNNPIVLSQYALFRASTGDYVDAIAAVTKGMELGFSGLSNTNTDVFLLSGDFEAVAGEARRALTYDRSDGFYYFRIGEALALLGDLNAGLEYLQLWESLDYGGGSMHYSRAALIYSLAGRPDDAQRMFDLMYDDGDPPTSNVEGGIAQLAVGNLEESLRLFQVAAEGGAPEKSDAFSLAIMTKQNIWNHPVLERPEFVEVRSRLGFQD